MQQLTIPLDHLSVLEFRGSDALPFLQAQLTADLRGLDGPEARFACACNPAGRVLGLLLLRRLDTEHVLALCARELAGQLRDALARYVLRSKVEIRLREDLAVCAPGAGEEDPELPGAIGFDSAAGRYLAARASELPPADLAVQSRWRLAELLMGVNWLQPATSERFLPQMLGAEAIGAVSFRKGCYPGQEVIARTRYLGKLKRHPLLCLVEGTPPLAPMDELILASGEDEASAVVVDCEPVNTGQSLLMLIARTPEGFSARFCRWQAEDYAVSWSAPPAPGNRLP